MARKDARHDLLALVRAGIGLESGLLRLRRERLSEHLAPRFWQLPEP